MGMCACGGVGAVRAVLLLGSIGVAAGEVVGPIESYLEVV